METISQLRAMMQMQKNINYIILGSQDSMMRNIFEKKKSPFYHFATMMTLGPIPYSDFLEYLSKRLYPLASNDNEDIANKILSFTDGQPYYTQKLAFHVWNTKFIETTSTEWIYSQKFTL